jgi:hypothetical protein
MKPKKSNLKIVNTHTEEHKEAEEQWSAAEDKLRISKREVRRRVRNLRNEMEGYRNLLDGMLFDVVTRESPYCLEGSEGRDPLELVEELNPFVKGYQEMLIDLAAKPACHRMLDDKFYLWSESAVDSSFQLGILAGAILAGCPKEVVDRFENGLAVAFCSRHWQIAKD